MKNLWAEKLGLFGAAGILGLGLIASVWQLWRGPVLVALFVALALLSLGLRPKGPAVWFLVIAGLVLPLNSLAHDRDFEHLYGLAVFLLLGYIGLMLGLQSSPVSIVFGVLLFQCVLIVVTLWTVVVAPEHAFSQTPYYYVGALTGPFEHRNILGTFLGLGVVPLLLAHRETLSEGTRTTLLGVSFVLLFATQSLTPVLALSAVSLFGAWRLNRDKISGFLNARTNVFKGLLVANGATVAVAIAVLLPHWIDRVRPSLGGRFRIWELAVQKLLEEFPFAPETKWIASEEVVRELGYNPMHAHNALLSLFLIYGILPTIVFVVAIICAIAIAVGVTPAGPAGVLRGDRRASIVVPGLLVYMVAHSTVEPIFLAGPVGALLVGVLAGTVLAPKPQQFAAQY
jgi:hypothetical protein